MRKERHTSRLCGLAIVLSGTLAVMSGCSSTPKLPPGPPDLGPPLTTEDIRDAIRENNRKLASIEAKVTLEILGPKAGGRCVGYLAIEKPRTMRIHASRALLPTLFDAYCDQRRWYVVFPREKIIYKGTTDRVYKLANTDLLIFPDDISRVLDQSALFFRKVAIREIWPDLYALTLVDVTSAPKPSARISARLFVDRANLQVVRMQLFDDEGQIRVEAALAEFTNIHGVIVPKTIELRWPRANTTLGIYLSDIKVNRPIDSKWLLYQGPTKEMQLIDLDRPDLGPRTVKPRSLLQPRHGGMD